MTWFMLSYTKCMCFGIESGLFMSSNKFGIYFFHFLQEQQHEIMNSKFSIFFLTKRFIYIVIHVSMTECCTFHT